METSNGDGKKLPAFKEFGTQIIRLEFASLCPTRLKIQYC